MSIPSVFFQPKRVLISVPQDLLSFSVREVLKSSAQVDACVCTWYVFRFSLYVYVGICTYRGRFRPHF